jgi:hypothetical protein
MLDTQPANMIRDGMRGLVKPQKWGQFRLFFAPRQCDGAHIGTRASIEPMQEWPIAASQKRAVLRKRQKLALLHLFDYRLAGDTLARPTCAGPIYSANVALVSLPSGFSPVNKFVH